MEKELVYYCLQGKEEDFGAFFAKLCDASYSVLDCIGTGMFGFHPSIQHIERLKGTKIEEVFTEDAIAAALTCNVLFCRPTGNGVGWGGCAINVSSYGVEYITGGGITFGWDIRPEWNGNDYNSTPLTVFCYAYKGGRLEKSLIEHGFSEKKR